ncbi:TPA: hypothetical protein N0F65_004701 [Lagenidium giganteum]|uniref:LAGLIDADG endonuclease n=1 Tax=Lagenidium giganteum TaxID=4803 RepID=A0AAV2Z3F0_9STRA|nr:TPA: hypothetical protein N0F65_004701 [Lagenidium giganteum]
MSEDCKRSGPLGSRLLFPLECGESKSARLFISLWDDTTSTWLRASGITSPRLLLHSGGLMATLRHKLYFGNAPYLFGYAAFGDELRLYAIIRVHRGATSLELRIPDLKHLEGRFYLLLAILIVARLCAQIAHEVNTTQQGIKLFLQPNCIMKCYPQPLFQQAEVVYNISRKRAVPNVDRLVHVDQRWYSRLVVTTQDRQIFPNYLSRLRPKSPGSAKRGRVVCWLVDTNMLTALAALARLRELAHSVLERNGLQQKKQRTI